eukprot:SAG11_NODE_2322_length_3523_cov_12.641063_3_plen_225_part_00
MQGPRQGEHIDAPLVRPRLVESMAGLARHSFRNDVSAQREEEELRTTDTRRSALVHDIVGGQILAKSTRQRDGSKIVRVWARVSRAGTATVPERQSTTGTTDIGNRVGATRRKCMLKIFFRSPKWRMIAGSSLAGSVRPSAAVPRQRFSPWQGESASEQKRRSPCAQHAPKDRHPGERGGGGGSAARRTRASPTSPPLSSPGTAGRPDDKPAAPPTAPPPAPPA